MARDYAKVSARFWTGETGRRLRALGSEVQLAALYLMTCPSSNMVGLYYLPVPVLAHETGLTFEGASKALRSLCEVGFALYDEAHEVVWVPEMARHQVGEELKPGDKQSKGVLKQAQGYAKCRFYEEFLEKYGAAFHLDAPKPHRRAKGGPSKGLRSQEQEQEQEQEQKAAAASALTRATKSLGSGTAEAAPPPPSVEAVSEPIQSIPPGTAEPGEATPASASKLGPAAPRHSAEAAYSPPEEAPRRPLVVLDEILLGPLTGEVCARVERRAEWRFVAGAPERRAAVRQQLETAVQALGVERAEELCAGAVERRKRRGLPPPKSFAYFADMLDEAVKGGNPMPPEVADVELDQVQEARDRETAQRWAPLLEQMPPSTREAFEADKAQLLERVKAQGLWTSAERRELEMAEEFLWNKWSRRMAGGTA